MMEVCKGIPEEFSFRARRRYLASKELSLRRRLSNNNGPSVPNRNVTNLLINETYSIDACNTHALCAVCVDANGTLNAFCEAFLLYYGGHVESYDVQLFWFNVHFWCQDEVLLSIENGTFAHDLDAGVIPSHVG